MCGPFFCHFILLRNSCTHSQWEDNSCCKILMCQWNPKRRTTQSATWMVPTVLFHNPIKVLGVSLVAQRGQGSGWVGVVSLSMSQTTKMLSDFTSDRPVHVLRWPTGMAPPPVWEARRCTGWDLSMSSFLPEEPQFTQHRDVCRVAQWASAPNIDVIPLISTLSLLLISLIFAWNPEKQQQTELFLSRTISSLWLPHTLRGRVPFYSRTPLHPPFMVYRSALRWYHWDSEALKCTITQNE